MAAGRSLRLGGLGTRRPRAQRPHARDDRELRYRRALGLPRARHGHQQSRQSHRCTHGKIQCRRGSKVPPVDLQAGCQLFQRCGICRSNPAKHPQDIELHRQHPHAENAQGQGRLLGAQPYRPSQHREERQAHRQFPSSRPVRKHLCPLL